MNNPIQIDDAIVLLLGADAGNSPRGELQGITRLEKLVFLLERETSGRDWITESAEFEPYNFGPFSQKVYQAIDLLSAAEIVEDSSRISPDDVDTWESREKIGLDGGADELSNTQNAYTTRDFKLTERGWRYFEALTKEIGQKNIEELETFKARFAPLPLRQLIRYVYTRYEDFTSKSVIRDDILGSPSRARPAS